MSLLIMLIVGEPHNHLIIDQMIMDARPFRALLESAQRARPLATSDDGRL